MRYEGSVDRFAARREEFAAKCRAKRNPVMAGFEIEAVADGEATAIKVNGTAYRIGGGDPEHYAAFYAELNRDFGIRDPYRNEQWFPKSPS